MPHLLQNNDIRLAVDLPHEGYNHPRFDWTGKIIDVQYKGISLAGFEKEDAPPGEFIGRGFYNEFGIERPIGFTECRVGDWFHKIGVGLLQKDGDEYAFFHPYKIRALEFHIEKADTYLIFTCESPIVNGYGYRYERKLMLMEDGFRMHYRLENIGFRIIETDEYNHNFTMIDEDKIGKNYKLRFPFKLRPGSYGEALNPQEVVDISDCEVSFNHVPASPFFYSYLNGKDTIAAHWELIHRQSGIGISEIVDFKTFKVNLWGWKGAISPELFIDIRIKPGESKSWSRYYQISEIN